MDKDIPQAIQQIRNSTSFEEVLQLASNFMPIEGKDIRATRAIDGAWKARRTFTFKDWISLHELGTLLWFRQYSRSSISFKFEGVSNSLYPIKPYKGFMESIIFLLKANEHLIKFSEAEPLRNESLKTWKYFMATLAYISFVEQKYGKKREKSEFNGDDLLFGILAILALIIGLLLGVLVSITR